MRHTLQTFITLSHWFLIFVNKREELEEDERTRCGRRWRTRYVGCWRTGHGGHRPTKEGDNVSKGYHSRTRVYAPRPP